MSEDKLKQELLYMVKLAEKYDFRNELVVSEIKKLESQRQILTSVFGQRFLTRITELSQQTEQTHKCVVCGKLIAKNGVICESCMNSIGNSFYANNINKIKEKDEHTGQAQGQELRPELIAEPKAKIKIDIVAKLKEKIKLAKANDLKKEKLTVGITIKHLLARILAVCLTLILFTQIWVLYVFYSIPDYNPLEEARVSSNPIVAVSNVDEAKAQIMLDFPEEEGYTVTFCMHSEDYEGRFLVDLGANVDEVEANLSEEERYEYFFSEDTYLFFVTYHEENTAKAGIAEINSNGEILIQGSFNDGRATDSFYRFR